MDNAILAAAIQAGLHDTDVKNAVIDYLKAETAKASPEKEWREVWRQVSTETRRYDTGMDYAGMGRTDKRDVHLVLIASYSVKGIGAVRGYMVAVHDRVSPHYWRPDDYFGGAVVYESALATFQYTDVIRRAQAVWPEAWTALIAKTLDPDHA